jgi:hypothetical protein
VDVSFTTSGSFAKTNAFLLSMQNIGGDIRHFCESAGARGVAALAAATPVDSGLTAASWGYEVESAGDTTTITWTNTNSSSGVNVAIILQYGHGTGTGGWVSGRDYIMPAIQPIFDSIADDVWKKVTTA